jgi:hypothetical protein
MTRSSHCSYVHVFSYKRPMRLFFSCTLLSCPLPPTTIPILRIWYYLSITYQCRLHSSASFLLKLHQFGLKRCRCYSPECSNIPSTRAGNYMISTPIEFAKHLFLYIYGFHWGLLGLYGSFPVAVLCSRPIFIPRVPTIPMRHSDINYCLPWLACIFWPSPESALFSTASQREGLTFTHSGVNKVAGLAHHPFSSSYRW